MEEHTMSDEETRAYFRDWSATRTRYLMAELEFDEPPSDEDVIRAGELVGSWLKEPARLSGSHASQRLASYAFRNCVAVHIITVGTVPVSAAGWAKKLRDAGLPVTRARVGER